MKLFRLRWQPNEKHRTEIAGSHKWCVPWLRCPFCGWNSFQLGIAYPAADLSALPAPERFFRDQYEPLPPDEISGMVADAMTVLPYALRVPPGSQFGPFNGSVESPKHDFAWSTSFPFLTQVTLERLRDRGIVDLFAVPTEITYDAPPQSPYLELQIEHEVTLDGDLRPPQSEPHKKCAKCGKDNGLLPSPVRIKAESVPHGVNLMRCQQFPALRLISEQFAAAIRDLGLTGVAVEPVKVEGDGRAEGCSPKHLTNRSVWKGLEDRIAQFQLASLVLRRRKSAPKRARRLARHTASLKEMLVNSRLAGRQNQIEKLCKQCVRVVVTPDKSTKPIRPGTSKFGGLPDLPKGCQWPSNKARPLDFLAQINLSELVAFEQSARLPAKGWLYFFYDNDEQPWGIEPADCGLWRVLYFAGKPAALRPRQPLRRANDPLPQLDVRFMSYWSLPPSESESVKALRFNKVELASYERLIARRSGRAIGELPLHKIGGFPDAVQSEQMPVECERMARLAGLRSKVSDALEWELLLQLDPDEDAGMVWSDAGRLYFWISRSDLAACNFSRVWCILQSH